MFYMWSSASTVEQYGYKCRLPMGLLTIETASSLFYPCYCVQFQIAVPTSWCLIVIKTARNCSCHENLDPIPDLTVTSEISSPGRIIWSVTTYTYPQDHTFGWITYKICAYIFVLKFFQWSIYHRVHLACREWRKAIYAT